MQNTVSPYRACVCVCVRVWMVVFVHSLVVSPTGRDVTAFACTYTHIESRLCSRAHGRRSEVLICGVGGGVAATKHTRTFRAAVR